MAAPKPPAVEIAEPVAAAGTNAAEDALVRQLAALLEAVSAMDDQGKPLVEPNNRQNVIHMLTRLQRNIEDKDFRNAIQTCDNLASTPVSPAFRKMIKELCAAISLRIKAEQTTLANELRGLLASIPAACAVATNQDNLQSLSVQIQLAQRSLSRSSENDNPELSLLRNNLQNAQELVRGWGEYLAAEAAGDFTKALESLNQLLSRSSYNAFASFTSSPDIKKRLDRLQSAVAEDALKVIKTAREGMLKATTSREVQALSLDFTRQYSRLQQSSNRDPVLQQDIESTRNALSAWARVLNAEERGDVQAALQSLQNMENDYYGRTDIQLQNLVAPKRSALILKLLDQPAPADDSLVKVVSDQMAAADSPDKLIELRRRLTPLLSNYSYSRSSSGAFQAEVQSLMTDIQILENWRGALQARQYGQILQLNSSPYSAYAAHYSTVPHRWKTAIDRHQNRLRAQALAAMFALKDFEVKEGQTPDEALLQAADKAAADKQWETLAVTLDAYRVAVFGSQTPPASLTDQIAACRSFIAARNYEKAGDLPRAAASYLAALNAPAKRAPVEEAFKELARLRKDHPDIFEKARTVSAATAPAAASGP
ncbi:MAG: hypothetical protein HY343_06410 [Lentisphaerae bacterium]|nr:hypothetical protein [Lentisphaerota bacterium]